MRIKLSKQNWRLVGNKMGWLKRAQVAGNPTLPAAPAAPVPGKAKVTPKVLPNQPNNNSSLPVKFNEEQNSDLRDIKQSNERLQQEYLRNKNPDWMELATGNDESATPTERRAIEYIYDDYELYGGMSGKNSAESNEQLEAFEKEFNKQYSILTATRRLVLAGFKRWWASQPHPEPISLTREMRYDLYQITTKTSQLERSYLTTDEPEWTERNFMRLATGDYNYQPSEMTGIKVLYDDDELWGGTKGRRSAESNTQLEAFDTEFNKQYSILTAKRQLVARAFKKWWASQPRPENTEYQK